jgi:hypothetical protein
MSANYPLKELNYATDNVRNSSGQPESSLKNIAQESGSFPIKISDFQVGSVARLMSTKDFVSYGDIFTVYVQFASEKNKFSKIKRIFENYTLNYNNNPYIELISQNPPFFTYKNIYNGPDADTGNSAYNFVFSITFYDDSFNENATNYNTPLTKTVTLYSPPQPIITAFPIARPPRSCQTPFPFQQYSSCTPNPGNDDSANNPFSEADRQPWWEGSFGCCGASIEVYWDSSSYYGVGSDFVNISIQNLTHPQIGPNIDSRTINTVTAGFTGNFSVGSLQGNNQYILTITNKYGKKTVFPIITLEYV